MEIAEISVQQLLIIAWQQVSGVCKFCRPLPALYNRSHFKGSAA